MYLGASPPPAFAFYVPVPWYVASGPRGKHLRSQVLQLLHTTSARSFPHSPYAHPAMATHPATPAANTRWQLFIDCSSKPQTPNFKPQALSPKPQTPSPKEQRLAKANSNQAQTRPVCECPPSRRAADRSMDSDGPGLAEMAFALDMALDLDDDTAMFLDDCSAAPSFGSPSYVTTSSFVALERMSQQERAALFALLSSASTRGGSSGKKP